MSEPEMPCRDCGRIFPLSQLRRGQCYSCGMADAVKVLSDFKRVVVDFNTLAARQQQEGGET